jgi:hypothetical protein
MVLKTCRSGPQCPRGPDPFREKAMPEMTRFNLTTALTPALLPFALVASPALAATTVSTATTTPLTTSSAGDVTVASGGTITVPSGTAVTGNSNNSVTVASGGTLTVGDASNANGMIFVPGIASAIENDGIITVLETYSAADTNGNGIAAEPIASATGRSGITVGANSSGSVTNTGTITVDGLNSAGIRIGANYTGSVSNTGTITVKGDNSVGLATGAVTGNVTVAGTITAIGQGARAVLLGGDITGTLLFQGAASQAYSYTTDAGATQVLSRSALQTGTAAVEVDGNVAKGLVVYAYCSPTTVSSVASCTSNGTITTTASIASVGNGPALQVGGANNITIGAGASNDGSSYSLVLDGSVSSTAYYSRTDAFGVVIGGQGGNVTLTNGIGVTGSVSATTVDQAATAILINAGSTATSLTNSGTIKATISSPGVGASYAIRDLSGTLVNVTNHGVIAVTGTSEDTTAAIALSANTTGVTVTQSLSAYEKAEQVVEQAASGYTYAGRVTYASITGDILTGTGNDTIAVSTGTVTGSAYLGGGNDTVALSGDTTWTGNLTFGSGSGKITLANTSTLTGALYLSGSPVSMTIGDTAAYYGTATTGTGNLAVQVNSGGTFGAAKVATLAVGSLNVASGGILRAYIDGTTGTSSLVTANTATFATGSKVAATINSLASAAGTYHILSANSLSGIPTFDATATSLPVLFSGALATQGNDLYLTVARKTAAQIGLNSSESAAYEAIYADAVGNTSLGSSLLQVADVAGLQAQMDTLLPDHAGAVFDFATRASRIASRHITDDSSIYDISDVGAWIEPILFTSAKAATGTAAWSSHGFGLSGGMERKLTLGQAGISGMWTSGTIHSGTANDIKANVYELGAFWRLSEGPLYTWAKLAADRISLKSTRTFTGALSGTALTYSAAGAWAGWGLSGSAGASYKLALPGNFSLKPLVSVDYYRLSEHGFAESGSTEMALTVAGRKSDSTTATTTLTAAWSMGKSSHDERPLTIELEGGRRSLVSGNLGATTAYFSNGYGSSFTITPDALKSGWLGEARLLMGGFDYTWSLGAGAEQVNGKTDMTLRAGLSMAL